MPNNFAALCSGHRGIAGNFPARAAKCKIAQKLHEAAEKRARNTCIKHSFSALFVLHCPWGSSFLQVPGHLSTSSLGFGTANYNRQIVGSLLVVSRAHSLEVGGREWGKERESLQEETGGCSTRSSGLRGQQTMTILTSLTHTMNPSLPYPLVLFLNLSIPLSLFPAQSPLPMFHLSLLHYYYEC